MQLLVIMSKVWPVLFLIASIRFSVKHPVYCSLYVLFRTKYQDFTDLLHYKLVCNLSILNILYFYRISNIFVYLYYDGPTKQIP